MAVTTDKPSIAELQRLSDICDGWTWIGKRDAGVLLEIVAAAKELEPELSYLQGPLSERLRAALSKVRS